MTAEGWRDVIAADPHFVHSGTPRFLGRGVAALAADPGVARWAGQALASWQLAAGLGSDDVDGARPDWGAHFATP